MPNGLLARVPYRDGTQRTRHKYGLTEKGDGLATVLVALMQWGNQHMPHPDGRPLHVMDRVFGQEVRAALVRDDGQRVEGVAAFSGQPWPDCS